MPFGIFHHSEPPVTPPPNAVSATALVTATEEPVEHLGLLLSEKAYAKTQILVDAGRGPVLGYQLLPLDRTHWLSLGQSIPVFVDPAKPDEYVVDWANVASIEDRVASKEASLVDPMGARLRAWDALAAAGYHEPDLNAIAPQLLQSEMTELRARLAAEPESFAKQLASVSGIAAPDGWRRGLARISTQMAGWQAADSQDIPHRQTLGNHDTVLAVNVPGGAPYAVLIQKFDHEDRQYDPYNPGLPAIVSIEDPSNVRVQWDEMPKSGPAIPDPVTEAEAVARIQATPSPVNAANAPTAMQTMMSAQANAMLARMAPAARPATIAYYKQMGVEIDPSLMP